MQQQPVWVGDYDFMVQAPKVRLYHGLQPGERISQGLGPAAEKYQRLTGLVPEYVFLAKMPRGVEEGLEVNGTMVLQAEWVPNGWLVLEAPKAAIIAQEFSAWQL